MKSLFWHKCERHQLSCCFVPVFPMKLASVAPGLAHLSLFWVFLTDPCTNLAEALNPNPLTLTGGRCLNFPWLKMSRRGRWAVKVNTCLASKSNIPGDHANLSPLTLPSRGSNYAGLEAPGFSSSARESDLLRLSERPPLITWGHPLRSQPIHHAVATAMR